LAWKRRRWEKQPRPPKWSTVKGRRAMLALLRARMMEELEMELWVRPVSFDRMLPR
jgi:limonene-1,2-epoxide hydrolase